MVVWVPSATAVIEVTAAWRLVALVLEAAMSERTLRIWHEPRFILWSFLMVLQLQIRMPMACNIFNLWI